MNNINSVRYNLGSSAGNFSNNNFLNANKKTDDSENSDTVKGKPRKKETGPEITTYTDKEGRVHKTFTGKGTDVVETMGEAAKVNKDDKAKVKKRLNYSYHKVSNAVLMAKNSMSASKAVLVAKRSLSELKRKLKTAECSDEEKQAALAHATRMLKVADKKKKHMQLEELISNTMKADEKKEKLEDSINEAEYSEDYPEDFSEDYSYEELGEDLTGDYIEDYPDENMTTEITDDILEEALTEEFSEEEISEDIFGSMMNMAYDAGQELTEDMLEEMSAELMEEMNEELSDLMDMMEVINPHMDEEHFEKLKTKHRCDEQKDIVKADMDYLKVTVAISQGGEAYTDGDMSGTFLAEEPSMEGLGFSALV